MAIFTHGQTKSNLTSSFNYSDGWMGSGVKVVGIDCEEWRVIFFGEIHEKNRSLNWRNPLIFFPLSPPCIANKGIWCKFQPLLGSGCEIVVQGDFICSNTYNQRPIMVYYYAATIYHPDIPFIVCGRH